MLEPKYHVVLIRPDIAGNTGNIGRSCMALGCRLHLVHPLGYKITDANLKRAGMDYWPNLDLKEHGSVEAWLQSLNPEAELYLLSTKADKNFSPQEVKPGAVLVFGSETAGLPDEIWQRYGKQARKIDMDQRARSLNLSSCVAMILGSLIL
jgi:tRNA (cytidine/uridine-2'-O-)-methyltransferase